MQPVNVLVTFASRAGATEKLALAAALGAVQARANIRLRWLRENVASQTIAAIPAWQENRARMAREYIAPREIDLLWADVLVLALPARDAVASAEIQTYLDPLRTLHSAGKLGGKVGTAFTAEPAAAGPLVSLCSLLNGLDLILVPPDPSASADPVDSARLHGRKVTGSARELKPA
jgi:NAD(P)H dehydrogenase (quinone)